VISRTEISSLVSSHCFDAIVGYASLALSFFRESKYTKGSVRLSASITGRLMGQQFKLDRAKFLFKSLPSASPMLPR